MIHRTHRFHGIKSLGFVFRQGKVVHGAGFSLRFVQNSRNNAFRLAVVVSRKVSKSAVVRNRIRRRIYEAVRRGEGSIPPTYDLVFLVRDAELATIDGRKLTSRVQALLMKTGIMTERQTSATDKNHAIVGEKEKITQDVHDIDRPADL